MMTTARVVTLLRILLVLAFAAMLLAQVMMVPGQLGLFAEGQPDRSHRTWVGLAVWEFWLLCVQVVIVCTWKLLTLVRTDRIFSTSSLVWVDVIVAACGAAWVVLAGLWLYVGFTADDPGLPLLLTILLVAGAVLALLMVVLRALLQQATTLRTDMEAVI